MKMTYFDYNIKGFVPFSGQTENGFAVVGRVLDRDGNVIEQGYLFKAYTDEEREAFFAQNTGGGIGVGEDGYSPIWLEKQPPTAEELNAMYKTRVVQLIRQKYDASDEFAILRQKDEKPDEYAEYNAYCEQCKKTAKAEIYGGTQ